MPKDIKKLLLKADELKNGKELALAKEFIDITENVDTVIGKIDSISDEIKLRDQLKEIQDKEENKKEVEISKINGVEMITLKGEKGDTPQKGKDYFTDEEVKSFLNKITPVKGKDYFDGKQGPQGPEGKQGPQGPQGPQGDPGINGRNGKDGRDGSPDTAEQIVEKLESLTEESRLDASAIKNLPEFIQGDNRIGFGSMIKEAPKDNKYYARKNREWVEVASPDLSAYVPNTRTLTINGTTYDLSADRTWTIAVPTKTSDLTNDSGFVTSSSLSGYLQNNVGISGGTTLVGGTLSGNNLTLSSTSHATKGKILFGTSAYDEVNNRLGIGTTTPLNKLDVYGDLTIGNGAGAALKYNSTVAGGGSEFVIQPIYSGTSIVSLRPAAGSSLAPALRLTDSSTDAGGSHAFSFGTGSASLPANAWNFFSTITGNANTNSWPIYFGVSNPSKGRVVAMTIDNTANVGIGTISPTAVLHLKAGTATANTAPLKFTTGTNLTTAEAGVMEYDGTSLFFTPASTRYNVLMNGLGLAGGQTVVGGTASGNNLTLSSTSNATKGKILFGTSAYDEVNNRLGIGTTSPGYKLDIQGAAAETSLTNTTNNNRISFGFPSASGGEPSLSAFTTGVTNGRIFQRQNSTKDVFMGDIDANGGGVHIRTNGNDSLNILSGGNVGIGQSSPTAVLHLKAGTATAGTAPLKLTSGTNLTTPENGTFEYDGTNLYFTVGGVRKTVTLI